MHTFIPKPSHLAHTYSIVARDPATGQLGVAVQSHWFSVGTKVAWAEAGVGAIATQSFVNEAYGPEGLALLKQGLTAAQVVEQLTAADNGRDYRQLAIVDAHGGVAAYTGQKCVGEAGHTVGQNFSVQANLMLTNKVWPAMAAAFEASSGPLAERLVGALKAAQAQGGDIRGQQSAALVVVTGQPTGQVWLDRRVDLRVDDHRQPLTELARLLKVHRAYRHMNEGDTRLEQGDVAGALAAYEAAAQLYPDNPETVFWHAVTLVNVGRLADSLPLFAEVFRQNDNWRAVVSRLAANGILTCGPAEVNRILNED